MKLKYKHQRFQEDAARAVTDCFLGQPHYDGASNFLVDQGIENGQRSMLTLEGFANAPLEPGVPLRDNIRRVQTSFGLKPIDQLEGDGRTLTIEMETGTGKTFTYIKTMFELNKLYGWTKFIVVVPSIAIREGVLSSFDSMSEYFAQEYGKRIQYFVYNSKQLSKIDSFASDAGMHVMIINTQAFNTSLNEDKNKEGRAGDAAARIIFSRRDEFRSRRPIDILAATHPIMIIDEPQSVLGANKTNQTRKGLKLFNPLFKLLYSATHRKDDIANMVYRLDAMDAYNKHLVKKIEVVGVEQKGTTATNGYVYLEQIIISTGNPQARINYDVMRKSGTVTQQSKIVSDGFDLYEQSGGLEEYRDGFIIDRIDGRTNTIHFVNGQTLEPGQMIGKTTEDVIRRNQIRETIRKHIERESQLFPKHIKVLSLFFIDHVSSYRLYGGEETKGKFAKMFEEEYPRVLQEYIPYLTDSAYLRYLQDPRNAAENIHQGYFSMDKKGHMVDPKTERGSDNSNDESAYDLIMKDKERLLSLKEPVRFIFSHSALKEGWDNPNVFQICTLKESDNENKKRQEVGRGMRLCVNDRGDRQDADVLGEDGVFNTNILTVIASESYDRFADGLQHEIADACADRPVKVTEDLFVGVKYTTEDGSEHTITDGVADDIQEMLIEQGYIHRGKLTDKYFADKDANKLDFGELDNIKETIVNQLDGVFDRKKVKPTNGRGTVEGHFNEQKFKDEFMGLWKEINIHSYYTVHFDSQKLIDKAVQQLDKSLNVTEIKVVISTGSLEKIESKQQLEEGTAMKQGKNRTVQVHEGVGSVRYDLIGQLVSKTGLTRKTIVAILQGIDPQKTFHQFQLNPEEFIMKSARIINSCKAMSVIEHIEYNKMDGTYDKDVFTENTLRGKLGENAMASKKSLYDLVVVDSKGEMDFAEALEKQDMVQVYTKLPRGFYINTPMGHYNPDWAVVFKEDSGVRHIYFIAETKGSIIEADLRDVEKAKIACATKHFQSIGASDVQYDVVNSWDTLYNKVMK
ncbi:MAG: DEAD/DEAH box helicase family protein [Prevotella sp.]|jgi:type III restriction enzyme|nr:DEAD/DEAH box helicase family protein [Prevotella sp.]MCI1780530.1 DEAD/DEAH box helicase family protein [Prevotella sp.]MCI2137663.1 DEAD/DEAH box helicase family protein [Prevotella sp.]MCI2150313.1 DEAD/DEAH box helicase family protein [Prevotella sp.]